MPVGCATPTDIFPSIGPEQRRSIPDAEASKGQRSGPVCRTHQEERCPTHGAVRWVKARPGRPARPQYSGVRPPCSGWPCATPEESIPDRGCPEKEGPRRIRRCVYHHSRESGWRPSANVPACTLARPVKARFTPSHLGGGRAVDEGDGRLCNHSERSAAKMAVSRSPTTARGIPVATRLRHTDRRRGGNWLHARQKKKKVRLRRVCDIWWSARRRRVSG